MKQVKKNGSKGKGGWKAARYDTVEHYMAQVKRAWIQMKKAVNKWVDCYEKFQSKFYKRRRETENAENLFLPRLNIKLKNFEFYHTAITSENTDEKYIHRRKFENKLKTWLTEKSGHGVYLVSGHRGAGKSSLVGAVIKEIKDIKEIKESRFEEFPEYINICVNIGQDNIKELHILHVVVKKLRGELAKARSLFGVSLYAIFRTIDAYRWWLLSYMFLLCYFRFNTLDWGHSDKISIFWQYVLLPKQKFSETVDGKTLVDVFLNSFFWVSLLMLIINWFIWRKSKYMKSLSRLDVLCERLYGSTQEVVSRGVSVVGLLNQHRKERMNPVISIREIEYDLTEILDNLEKKWRVVIVFDELDKVEPREEYNMKGGEQLVASEIRRQKVLDMIANMKYFLSTARAYFVFIAGPELYDAAMADISDREFAIGNLFNGILSVDSFYTTEGLGDAIELTEEFVCRQICGAKNLRELCVERKDKGQLVFLYHFICYLAFISHGSPKKIAVFFEKYIRDYKYLKDKKQAYGISKKSKNKDWYLTFSDHQQMKINFVHYLAFPILQNIMNRSAIFGDKLRVAESFIFAHIVKLHNGGFSWRNIEQIPEIMAVNRAPEMREYIQAILKNMAYSRLSPIMCGLYAYKFPLRLAEEISYFSKLSDELSALLNFSIGELQPIKEHYFALLDKSPTDATHKKRHSGVVAQEGHIYAEASVRHALGDIYMQEENFSAAIQQFEHCVELTMPLLKKSNSGNYTQIQNYVLFCNRTMLKLGLAHEKRHTDNSAYVVYDDLLRVLSKVREDYEEEVNCLFYQHRALHLGILARLYVLERMGTTGIEGRHVDDAIDQFDKLYPALDGTLGCNSIVKADFYRKLGDILYYKNHELQGKQIYSAIWAYREGIKILLKCDQKEDDNAYLDYIHSKITIQDKGVEEDEIWLSGLVGAGCFGGESWTCFVV